MGVIPPALGPSFDPATISLPNSRSHAEWTPFPDVVPAAPREGERNAFGGLTPAALATAWDAQLRNDIDTGLQALAELDDSSDPLTAWLAGFIRVQMLLASGRAAEAKAELPQMATREIAWIGHDLNSEALRGEVLVWIGDFEAARFALASVLHRTAAWRLPVTYGGPPTNLGQIVSLTNAQLRAQTAMGALHFLQGDAEKAHTWASAAEARSLNAMSKGDAGPPGSA